MLPLDENNIVMLLEKLTKLGLQLCTDESDRFNPSWETQRILKNRKTSSCYRSESIPNWPFIPWHEVHNDNDVLVWTGSSSSNSNHHHHDNDRMMIKNKSFGHDWPIIKIRGKVKTTPRTLLNFLLDSTQIKKYNKMSQGREDVIVIQEGIDTTCEESLFGITGDVKVMRALNKPKMSPKTIETICLCYAKRLEEVEDDDDNNKNNEDENDDNERRRMATPNSYIIVNRSVWEGSPSSTTTTTTLGCNKNNGNTTNTPTTTNNHNHIIRSEMVLGVQLIRPWTRTRTTNNNNGCGGGGGGGGGADSSLSSSLTRNENHEEEEDDDGCCELTTITHVCTPGVPEIMAKRLAPGSAANLMREIQSVFSTPKNKNTSSSWKSSSSSSQVAVAEQ